MRAPEPHRHSIAAPADLAPPLPETSGFDHLIVETPGLRTHVATIGDGEPVVMLHGFPLHWWQWHEVAPLIAEQGYRGLEMMTWAGLFVPQKTPPEVVARLHAEVARIVRQPDVVARLADMGYVPGNLSQPAFAQQVSDEKDRWGELIRQAGIKPE